MGDIKTSAGTVNADAYLGQPVFDSGFVCHKTLTRELNLCATIGCRVLVG